MNLLAKSCFCPGIISLIGNLVTSAGDIDQFESRWLTEYCHGKGHEIYRVKLPMKFAGKKFS